jgi:hypothetical protein
VRKEPSRASTQHHNRGFEQDRLRERIERRRGSSLSSKSLHLAHRLGYKPRTELSTDERSTIAIEILDCVTGQRCRMVKKWETDERSAFPSKVEWNVRLERCVP